MHSIDDAFRDILAHVLTAESVSTPLADSLDLVLAEDLTTPHDSPPFDKSMMDGFAVNSGGFADAGSRTLPVLETITAGTVPQRALTPDCAARIMTGAPLPGGADAVVPIELVAWNECAPETVTIRADKVAAERNVLRQGCSARSGTPLMSAGTLLQPQHIAVLAEFGVAAVPTFRRPTVAVLATGDELIDVAEPLSPGRIRNSNEPMLIAQIRRANATPVALGVARDNRDDLRDHIARGLQHDFLLLSGGVSAGMLDLVPSELAAAGVREVFHGVGMKPGKPLWFGDLRTAERHCSVFGLPGNPVSSMVCFELFVRSAIRQFSGWQDPLPLVRPALLTEEISIRGDRPTYFPAVLRESPSGLTATPVKWGGSADLRATANANGMCLFEPCAEPYAAGMLMSAISWS